jgi:hypothetical protein
MLESIKDLIMRRDEISADEADRQIEEARQAFNSYLEEGDMESAENICDEYFGLEPDYIIEFI